MEAGEGGGEEQDGRDLGRIGEVSRTGLLPCRVAS